ncbi:MAG: PD-(D/E)XK nuclease family protein [Clostridia bacterium]|nr:PD-(D/E)XK nuclease family protein [Clostridia bacterium]
MLQFIFGLPKTGKTTYIINNVKALADKGKKSVIIVPEQASFETEKAVFKAIGDSFSQSVEILSFSRLYDEVCRKTGGTAARNLNDSDKIIFMNKSLKSVSGELKSWSRYAKSLTFAKSMLDAIGEFKINGITPATIKETLDKVTSESLKRKLCDLALIYEAYDLFTNERFIDPADKLTRLYYKLENISYFKDKTVFFDCFKGFTGQQYKIIDRVFQSADDVYFAFTNDTVSIREYDVFTNIRTAVNKIEATAKKHAIKIEKPLILDTAYSNFSLSLVERLVSENKAEGNCGESVAICEAKTVFDEAEFAARTIRKLVRTENLRYRDFAIITRDSEKYNEAVEYACKKNNIDCFFDKKLSLLYFPLAISVLAAIKSLNFSTENILRFHKSGIGLLTTEEISELENYTYIWKISGEIWLNDWNMDVRGFVTDEPDQNNTEALERINNLRRRAIEPIVLFKESFYGNVKQKSKAIFNLLEFCNASKALINLCNKFGDDSYSKDALKQSYAAFMNILDSIVTCYNNADLTPKEYYEVLYLSLSLEEVGLIPQTLDQVIFGQADRVRLSNPKVVFILGANQGIFPKFADNNGIFAIKERKALIDLGLEIADNEIFTSIDEKFLVYSNLSAPTDRLYISYSKTTLNGKPLEKSSFVSAIEENLNPKVYFEPYNELTENTLPETKSAAFSEFCRSVGNNADFSTLKAVLDSEEINTDVIKSENLATARLSKAIASELYGNNINMSATKFDTFHRCKFSHFCKYGLRLKKLQPADFDVLQRGTIVHFVLEKIISEYKENIKDLTRNQLDVLCDKYIALYLDSVQGYRSVETARHRFIISKISRSLKEVIYHLSLEFSQSNFKPAHCELTIGYDGIPLRFPFSSGEINILGSIDRVDKYNGYIRIIDYKTGTKSFKLPDILFGLNLQMLIYLYAITRGQNLPDSTAAGIFYMPAKRDLNNDGMAMNGLMQSDLDLVTAMEKYNRGEFIPKLAINKDGSVSKTASSFISDAEFSKIFDYIEKLMAQTGDSIVNGEIEANPIDGRESAACDYCDFKSVCALENKEAFRVPDIKNVEVFEIMEKEKKDGI